MLDVQELRSSKSVSRLEAGRPEAQDRGRVILFIKFYPTRGPPGTQVVAGEAIPLVAVSQQHLRDLRQVGLGQAGLQQEGGQAGVAFRDGQERRRFRRCPGKPQSWPGRDRQRG